MDLDQTDFSALLAGEERAWSRFILNARPVLEAALHRTFARQGLKPDAGLFQDAISASLERITADDFALLRRFDPSRGSIRAFLAVVGGSTASNSLRAARRHSGADLSAAVPRRGSLQEKRAGHRVSMADALAEETYQQGDVICYGPEEDVNGGREIHNIGGDGGQHLTPYPMAERMYHVRR